MKKLVLSIAAAVSLVSHAEGVYTETTLVRTPWECLYCGRTYTYEDSYERYYWYDNFGNIYRIGHWHRTNPMHNCSRCGVELDWVSKSWNQIVNTYGIKWDDAFSGPPTPQTLLDEDNDADWYNAEVIKRYNRMTGEIH